MNLKQFIDYLNSGKTVKANSEEHLYMHKVSQEALRITSKLNNSYQTPENIVKIFSELIGKPIDPSFAMFPPFYTDCGKNITVGKRVFINSGCRFQDQGGITIKDDALIGHNAVLATLNHGFLPDDRKDITPSPIVIGKNVWLGANVTVLPGVTVGDNSILAAGAVVSQDVPPNTVVGGVPAKFIKRISNT